MKIATSVVLLALGAVLAFAVQDSLEMVDLTIAGYILMGAGVIGLILSLVMANKTSKSATRVVENGPAGTSERVVESRNDTAPPVV